MKSIASHERYDIFTCERYDILTFETYQVFDTGENLVSHRYLYNKDI